jgi:site-specific DNA-methyltransferase (adenine-specific)
MDWAAKWLDEMPRILNDHGNLVIFGGFQFQSDRGGDLLEILHYLRHSSSLCFVNSIVWYYKSGMSAHRFFANRHEKIAWFSKTKRYTFNLDAVRIPYDPKTMADYLRDPRLNPDTVRKGKNPTNVWEIPRLGPRSGERVGHPTQKPAALIRRIVRALSLPGSIVLDFFAGSGTTTRVCIEEGRHSISSDIDPALDSYLSAHVAQIQTSALVPYVLLGQTDWEKHPVFHLDHG